MLAKLLVLVLFTVATTASSPYVPPRQPLHDDGKEPSRPVSARLFASLERFARLVDIAYCVGTTGLGRPFQCASRCKDFPSLSLVTTWNTGVLMSDSCGYVAVDHGAARPPGSHLKRTAKGDENGRAPADTDTRHGAIVVAFRGTYSITNTVVDLSTVPQEYVPYPSPDEGEGEDAPRHKCLNCTVHMGFLSSWKATRRDVLPTLMPLREQHPEYPIYLVGHSLGGAVAALAALEMRVALGWDDVFVTTFGEPRVGNDGFVRYLDIVFDLLNQTDAEQQTYRRLTHVDDPVPLLPLSEWGYRSHAGEIYISRSELPPYPDDIRTCVGDYDPNCSAQADGGGLARITLLVSTGDTAKHESLWTRWMRRYPGFPPRLKLWQLFFAHRDYFWRLGLCVPGGDPADWGRDRYPNISLNEEL